MSGNPAKEQFESLLLPVLDFLLGLAMQLTRSRDHAQDLVQEASLKACRSFSSFRPGSNFRAWIARILTNTFLTEKERAKRWIEGIDLDELPNPLFGEYSSEEADRCVTRLKEVPRDAFRDEVMSALCELPGDTALAVYLADVEELPYAEIGEVLGVPIGTVRSRISRGRRHLQARLIGLARDLGLTGRKSS
ncbi:MAG: sigma-70 family RNA polymerase sigma factor [Candidatus Krumholzibacteriia bacterium]